MPRLRSRGASPHRTPRLRPFLTTHGVCSDGEGIRMTKIVVAVFLLFISSSACLAQNSERYSRCLEKAGTQLAMNACASEEARRAEADLNAIYQKVLSATTKNAAFGEKIRAAERAWLAYRDAYIDAMYPAKDKQAAYGSVFSMEVNLLRSKLTQQQASALKELLKQYGESKQ